ncbi:MAG: Ig-like domain-containing protein [Chitinophagaceae bacterium]|nr:Ig-like domain-containing protein [Chitinophagaceae bacterium]
MKKLSTITTVLLIGSVFCYISIFSGGCAQIGMPVGGPRDTIPPNLVQATPPNFSTNFKSNKISLLFDEYIQLDNPLKNVIVSPLPKKNPFIDFKLKTVTVKLFDTLKPNTTYSLQFGNTIKDLNEGNPLGNFDYVFSTGKSIDSLILEGDVFVAETGSVDTTLTILLHADLTDSAVAKHRPDYITRPDRKGHFVFKFLHPGDYHIFAVKDEGGQFMYTSPLQLFAFYDSIVKPALTENAPIELYAFQAEKEAPKKSKPKAGEPLKFGSSLSGGIQDLLSPLFLSFNYPVEIDTSKIELTDTLYKKLPGTTISLDSTKQLVTVQHAWAGGEKYNLIIDTVAARDSLGKGLSKNDTLRFTVKNESEYGTIKLTFKNLEKYSSPLLQLVNDKGDVQTFSISGNVFEKKLIQPGTYHIQILEDTNHNGKWDTGNYYEKLQPEKVHRITETISIRANWDNERDVVL